MHPQVVLNSPEAGKTVLPNTIRDRYAMLKFGRLIMNKTLEIWESPASISVMTLLFLLCNAFENERIL